MKDNILYINYLKYIFYYNIKWNIYLYYSCTT